MGGERERDGRTFKETFALAVFGLKYLKQKSNCRRSKAAFLYGLALDYCVSLAGLGE